MKLQLKRSNVLELGAAKEPTSAQMEYGELAVNYNNGDPALFIKDSSDNIIRIGGAGSIGSGGTPSGPVPPSTDNEIGDIFFDTTLNSLVYWDGTSWNEISDSQNAAKIYVGSLAEINNDVVANERSNGFLWWNTEDGTLYVWYEDGNTEQWVVAVPSDGSGGGSDYVLKAGDTMTGDLAFTETTLSTDKLTLSADSTCLGLFGQIARAGVGFKASTSSYGMVTWVPAGASITRPDRFYNYYANLEVQSAGTLSQVGFSASSTNDAGVPVAGFQTQGDWNLQSGGAKGLDLTVAKNTAGSTNYNIYAGYSTGQAEVARSYFGSDVVFGKNPATASPGYGTAALGYLYKFSDGVTYISNTNASFRLNRSAAGNIIEFRQGGQSSVSGKIAVNGLTTSYVTSSDYRLKENVVPIGEAANRLKLLRPSQFNFKIEPSVVVDGFIAHEVEEVVPEAVSGVKDAVDEHGEIDPQGIDQSKLVPLLTAALQEALARIETLEAEVQQISDKLDSF